MGIVSCIALRHRICAITGQLQALIGHEDELQLIVNGEHVVLARAHAI